MDSALLLERFNLPLEALGGEQARQGMLAGFHGSHHRLEQGIILKFEFRIIFALVTLQTRVYTRLLLELLHILIKLSPVS